MIVHLYCILILSGFLSVTSAKDCNLFDFFTGFKYQKSDSGDVEIRWTKIPSNRYLVQLNDGHYREIETLPLVYSMSELKTMNILFLSIASSCGISGRISFRFDSELSRFNPSGIEASPLIVHEIFSTGVVLKWAYNQTAEIYWEDFNGQHKTTKELKRIVKSKTSTFTTIQGLQPDQSYVLQIRVFSESFMSPRFFNKTIITTSTNEITESGLNWKIVEISVNKDEAGVMVIANSHNIYKSKTYRIMNTMKEISYNSLNYPLLNIVDINLAGSPKIWSGRIRVLLTDLPHIENENILLHRFYEPHKMLIERITQRNTFSKRVDGELCLYDCYHEDMNGWNYTGRIHRAGTQQCLPWDQICSQSKNCSGMVFSDVLNPLNSKSPSKTCCRNPLQKDNLMERPWCYVKDANQKVTSKLCDISNCNIRDGSGCVFSHKILNITTSSAVIQLKVRENKQIKIISFEALSIEEYSKFLSPTINKPTERSACLPQESISSSMIQSNYTFSCLEPGQTYRVTLNYNSDNINTRQIFDLSTLTVKPETSTGISVTADSMKGLIFHISMDSRSAVDYRVNLTYTHSSMVFHLVCQTCRRKKFPFPSPTIQYDSLNPKYVKRLNETEFLDLKSVRMEAFNSAGFGSVITHYPTRLVLNCSQTTTTHNKKAILVNWFDPLHQLSANKSEKVSLVVNQHVVNSNLESTMIYSDISEGNSYCLRLIISGQGNRDSPITCFKIDYPGTNSLVTNTALATFFAVLLVIAMLVFSVLAWLKYQKFIKSNNTDDMVPIIEMDDKVNSQK